MVIWHGRSGRKSTGGKITLAKKKRKYELGRLPTHVTIGKDSKKFIRTKGGGMKTKSTSVEFANVLDKKTNVVKKVKIIAVLENPANPHFVRRGLITKGAVVKTEIGDARITSRPSQHGIVNAVVLDKDKS